MPMLINWFDQFTFLASLSERELRRLKTVTCRKRY